MSFPLFPIYIKVNTFELKCNIEGTKINCKLVDTSFQKWVWVKSRKCTVVLLVLSLIIGLSLITSGALGLSFSALHLSFSSSITLILVGTLFMVPPLAALSLGLKKEIQPSLKESNNS